MLISQQTDTPASHNSYRSIDPKRVVIKRISTSGVVYPKSCWLLWVKVYCPKVTQWIVPDNMFDPEGDWLNEDVAADENLLTFSQSVKDSKLGTKDLVLTLTTSIWFNGIVIYPETKKILESYNSLVYFYYWNGASYVQFFGRLCPSKEWFIASIVEPIKANKASVIFWNWTDFDSVLLRVYEIRFIYILDTKLLLRNGFTSQGRAIIDICPKWDNVENIIFKKQVKFNKGIYANLAPAGSYAEFGFIPDY